MRKGSMVIFFLLMILSDISVIRGQSADSVQTFPKSYHPISPFVVNAFPTLPLTIGMPGDTLLHPIGLLDVTYGKRILELYIDRDWKYITLTEYVDGEILRLPFTAPVDWYFTHMLHVNRQVKFYEVMKKAKRQDGTQPGSRRGGRSIEVVGVDLGEFGRASLRVRGNVKISGKMVFQDQELVRSSINETQNTHIEFDQKQNLNIEGKIGDRITVLMDQDSERDFEWENNIRISYEGKEDEIVKKIEAGNISLSLPSTQYVTFSGKNKGLFGLKAISQLGPVNVTTIASIEQTRKERQKYKGGTESQTQQIKDYEYVKNQYFFIHEWFRNGVDTLIIGDRLHEVKIPPFYPLRESYHLIGNVVVANFELYQESTDIVNGDQGIAHIDPLNPDEEKDEFRTFIWLERDLEYTLSEDLGYVRLRSRSQNEILACRYTLVNRQTGDTLLTIGRGIVAQGDTLKLKMLKNNSPSPNHPTWELMFKNVYSLGTTNINRDGFAIRIINDRITPPSDRDRQGIPHLTQFGLDSLNKNGDDIADELIDIENPNIVNLVTGELLFPTYYPFADADSIVGGNANPDLKGMLGAGLMYTTTDRREITGDSRFTIEADYTNPSAEIRLGFMLVEGSEEVLMNGIPLNRGIDYQIDYFTGTIVLGEAANDPNANIEILYDKHELVSFDKKVILGARAQMDLGEKSFIGATALYYNQSVINEKIEVGYEPTRNFIWDLNGRFESSLEGLTRALDKLPVIETERPSTFSIEGEFAQVLPNPNPINNHATGDDNGVAYIDDFEGAKRTTNPPIQRRSWKEAAAPIDIQTGEEFSQHNRAYMYWFNPYGQVRTKDIWPNQSTSTLAQNETTDILTLRYQIRSYQSIVPRDSIWAGITTAFYTGDYDQTQSKFFEIWLKGIEGKLTVDLGKISEDRNGNGVLDTEDLPESGLTLGNGFLEDPEDVGLDGCPNDYEDGLGGCFEYIREFDGKVIGDDDFDGLWDEETWNGIDDDGDGKIDEDINRDVPVPGIDLDDPNGDDWNYSEGSYVYNKVNGTEGNGTGTRIQEGGKYPDTEDLDRSGFLDKTNAFFTKTFSLDTTSSGQIESDWEKYKGGSTPKGWRLYRIPLSHFERIKDIEWNEIQNMRLSWTGVDSIATLQIAKIEMVGNEWQELGVASDSSNAYTVDDSVFAITIVNTEDNADYIPPKGVKGEYDRINEIRAKEQSLVLKFESLLVQQKAAAKKTLITLSGDRAKSYLTYDKMKMFVYGDSPAIGSDKTDVEFFIQFGLGNEYYEVTQPVYRGWDENQGRNSINLNLKWLTELKQQSSSTIDKFKNKYDGNETDDFIESVEVNTNLKIKEYRFTDDNGEITGKRVMIKGSPALSRIQHFIVGIRNTSELPISGEVWLDELRLSGVKKDRGIAMRVQSKFSLADIANTSVVYSRKDADFHVLQQRLGSNRNSEDLRVNTSIQLHKLLPRSIGLNIPVSTSFSNTVSRPKYFPGTDVLVDWDNATEALDSIASISRSINLSTSLSKSSKSDKKLIKYTLDNLKGSFSTSQVRSSNEIMSEVQSETYTGKLSYNLSFGRDNYIKPLKWMNFLPWVGEKIGGTQLYYTPSSFSTSFDISEKLVQKQSRAGKKSPDDYNLGLSRSFNLDYKITNSLSSKYNRSAQSDMDHYRGYAWMAIRDLDPGIVTRITENLSTSFTPDLSKWFRPNFNYSAGYRWDQPLGSSIDGANIGTQLRFSSSATLSPTTIFELFYKPSTKKTSTTNRRRRPTPEKAPDTETSEPKKEKKMLTYLHGLVKKIDPISMSYTQNLGRASRGVQGTIPIGYKFGWLPGHGLPYDSVKVGTNTGSWDFKRDLTTRSGLKITRNISLSYNYSQNVSMTRSGSGVEQRSLSRDYLSYGQKLEKGFPFVSWSLRYKGLERWPILNKYVRTASFEHAYSGKESRSWQFEGVDIPDISFLKLGSFIEDHKDFERSSRINKSFSPLVGISMTLKKGVSTNMRYNVNKSVEELPTGLTVRTDTTWSASANYSHRGGITIPLPFIENYKIQNTVNFTLNFDLNVSQTKGTKDKTSLTEQAYNSGWKIGTRISYSFSSRVSGGIIYEYRESENRTSGRKIDRDFGFDINISISG